MTANKPKATTEGRLERLKCRRCDGSDWKDYRLTEEARGKIIKAIEYALYWGSESNDFCTPADLSEVNEALALLQITDPKKRA